MANLVDILSGVRLDTVEKMKNDGRFPLGRNHWITCQVYFDPMGNILGLFPMTSDGKAFSMRVRRAGRDVVTGMLDIETQKEIENILTVPVKSEYEAFLKNIVLNRLLEGGIAAYGQAGSFKTPEVGNGEVPGDDGKSHQTGDA